MPWYLGMIDNKYVLMNSSYLLFDMSITGSDRWFKLYSEEWRDHIGIPFGKIAQISSLHLKKKCSVFFSSYLLYMLSILNDVSYYVIQSE